MPVRVFDSSRPLAASVFTASRITERLTPIFALEVGLLGKGVVRAEIAAHDANAELLHDLGEQVALAGRAEMQRGGRIDCSYNKNLRCPALA